MLRDTLEILTFSFCCSQSPWDRLGTCHLTHDKVIEPERKVAEDAEGHVSPFARGVQAVWSLGQQSVQDSIQHGRQVGVAVRGHVQEVALQPQQVVLTIVLLCVCLELLHQLLCLFIPQVRCALNT